MLCAKLRAVSRGILYKSYWIYVLHEVQYLGEAWYYSSNTAGLHPQNHREVVIKSMCSRWDDMQHCTCMFDCFWSKCANVCACLWISLYLKKGCAGKWVCNMQALWPCYCLICAITEAPWALVSTSGDYPGPLLAPQIGQWCQLLGTSSDLYHIRDITQWLLVWWLKPFP